MRYTAAFLAILGLILLLLGVFQYKMCVRTYYAEFWRGQSIGSMEKNMTEAEIRRVLEFQLGLTLREYLSHMLGADVPVSKPLQTHMFTTAACGAASLLWSIGLIVTSRRAAAKST